MIHLENDPTGICPCSQCRLRYWRRYSQLTGWDVLLWMGGDQIVPPGTWL